jgi:putative peptidoglycan lipid II flippase
VTTPTAVTRRSAPLDLLARYVPRGAILLSVLTFGSYVMGLVRDRILTRTYGIEDGQLDVFNAAFQIPELLFSVVVASGLAAPFIPVFTSLERDGGEARAYRFAQTILTLAVAAMLVVAVVLFALAPWTVEIAAPGFDAEARALYVELFRLSTISQVLFAGSMALGEVLIVRRRFAFYGLAPLLYNGGIVLGVVLLADRIGIQAAAVGAVLGAALHVGIRLVGVLVRTTYRPRFRLELRTPAIREFFRLMLPKTLSSPLDPIVFLFFTSVASSLAAGSITTVGLARNFQSVPISLIGTAFSLAVFPALAAAYAAGDRRGLIRSVGTTGSTIGILTVLAAAALVVIGPFAIEVLLGGGRFDAEAVARTAAVLSVFAIAIPFESLGHLLSRAIYATHHTLFQVVASLVGFAVTVVATLALVERLGVLAIPAAYGLGMVIRFALLVVVLGWRLRRMPDGPAAPTDPADPPGPGISPAVPGSRASVPP